MPFHKFLDVERLGKEEVEGILLGDVTLMPKLDGTNASVWADTIDGVLTIKTGSRTRELSLNKDNRGFCKYILENTYAKMYTFFEAEPNLVLFGEWLVPHNLKDYRDDMWNRFWIFDVFDIEQKRYLSFKAYAGLSKSYCFDIIPPLATIENPTMEQLNCMLMSNVFGMKDGFIGEGIVLKNYSFWGKFDRLTYGKLVRDEFKDMSPKKYVPRIIKSSNEDALEFAHKYVTKGRLDKIIANIGEQEMLKSMFNSRLLETLFYEVINEELYGFFKQGNKTLNSRLLKHSVIAKAKELLPEQF